MSGRIGRVLEDYWWLARQLEMLWEQGQGESELADGLRGRMDGPWRGMVRRECWEDLEVKPDVIAGPVAS